MKKQVFSPENPDGIIMDMTAEEQTQRQADIENLADDVSINQKIENDETLKASAKAKLIAGEPLTEDEANTIVL